MKGRALLVFLIGMGAFVWIATFAVVTTAGVGSMDAFIYANCGVIFMNVIWTIANLVRR